MDPIFDRLGRLIRSSFGGESRSASQRSSDPLEREAEEELDEFLRTGRNEPKRPGSQGSRTFHEQRRQEARNDVPLAVAKAYALLGLTSTATWDEINAAHRSLLKQHHPDRHAGNDALVKKATDQSQQINEAFQVLKKHLGR